MEQIFAFLLSLLASLVGVFGNTGEVANWPESASEGIELVEVIEVIDGDTIRVLIDGEVESVRYIGIDTPEPYRDGKPACYSQEASVRNQELVENRFVKLIADVEDKDKYDRLLRYVYVDDLFINEVLVSEGYAKTLPIKPNTKHAREFKELQDTAKERGLGLWGECDKWNSE